MFSRIVVLKKIKPQTTYKKCRNFHKNAQIFDNSDFPKPDGNKRFVIPEHIKKFGDQILAMNIYDSLLLGEYMKDRLGLPGDMPDPWQAIMLGLGNLSNPFAGFGGMPQMGGMQMQQQPVQQQQAPAAAATPAAEPAAPVEEAKEKSIFDIKLETVDPAKKINLIKELRKIDPSLGIKQAKELVETVPVIVKKDVPKEEAQKLEKILSEFGTVSLQ